MSTSVARYSQLMLDSKLVAQGLMMTGAVLRVAGSEVSRLSHGAIVVVFHGSGKPAVQVDTGDGEYATRRPVASTRGTARRGIERRV